MDIASIGPNTFKRAHFCRVYEDEHAVSYLVIQYEPDSRYFLWLSADDGTTWTDAPPEIDGVPYQELAADLASIPEIEGAE